MSNNSNIIRERIFNSIKNLLILFFIIFFISVIDKQPSYFQFQILEYTLTDNTILRTIAIIFFIYYGYYVLQDLKILLDIINLYTARALGYNEISKIKNITYSITALISLFLASLLVLPMIGSIPSYGKVLSSYLNLLLLLIMFIIIYNIFNEAYSLTKTNVDILIDKTLKIINDKTSKVSKKSDEK